MSASSASRRLEVFQRVLDASEELQSVSPGRRALAARVESLASTGNPEYRDRSSRAALEVFLRDAAEDGRVRIDVDPTTLTALVSSSYATLYLSWVDIPDFLVRQRATAVAQLLGTALAPESERVVPSLQETS